MYPCHSPFASEITNGSGASAFSASACSTKISPGQPTKFHGPTRIIWISAGMQAAGSFQPAIGRGAGQGDALLGAKEVDLGPAELWRWCANPVERRQAGRGIGRSTR